LSPKPFDVGFRWKFREGLFHFGINPIAMRAGSSQLAKHLIVLFSDRDSLTQKGKTTWAT